MRVLIAGVVLLLWVAARGEERQRLIARADKQLEGLTAFREAAAKEALGE